MLTAGDITFDILAGAWRIFQLRHGHRFSTDDLLTAWAAVRANPEARRLLDLGAGIGSGSGQEAPRDSYTRWTGGNRPRCST